MKLKELSPEAGARFIQKITGENLSEREYAERIKNLGLTPVGHVDEWAEYGIAAVENRERV